MGKSWNGLARGTIAALPDGMRFIAILACLTLVAAGAAGQTAAPEVAGTAEAESLAAAEARYRTAIALNPNIAAYHTSLALVLERLGRTAEADAAFAEAVRLDPRSARSRGSWGELLLAQNDLAGAIRELNAATQLAPGEVRWQAALGRALGAQGQWAAAEQAFERAVALAPADARIAALHADAASRSRQAFGGYHDLSEFADEHVARGVAFTAMELLVGVPLVLAAAVLLLPILGTVFLLLVQLPREWLRARSA